MKGIIFNIFSKTIFVLLVSFFMINGCDNSLIDIIEKDISLKHSKISVMNDLTNIIDGDTFYFANEYLGAPDSPVVFRIYNNGENTLLLSGVEKVHLSGTNAEDFEIILQPSGSISVNSYEEFKVEFKPTVVGIHTATVSIESNDPDTPIFSFTIISEATASPVPEIQILLGETLIPEELNSYSFGDVVADGVGGNSSSSVIFTIWNKGSADLTISNVTFSSGDIADFSLSNTTSSPLAPDETTAFSIVFDPISVGNKSAEVSISNNDDDENPSLFMVTGTAVSPEIRVESSSGEIFHNSTLDLGTPYTGVIVESVVTIYNDGSSDLHLSGSPVDVGGTDQTYFTLLNQPATTIAPGGHSSFTFQFTNRYNDDSGPRTAYLLFEHDDTLGPASPFQINLTAQAVEWAGTEEIDYHGGYGEIIYHYTAHPKVFAVYYDSGTSFGIHFERSDDGGYSWPGGYDQRIDTNGAYPEAHMNGERIAVIYKSGNDLAFRTSTDYGINWSSKQTIATNVVHYDIAGSSYSTKDLLYVCYTDSVNGNLMFRRSDNGGTTWQTAKTVDSSAADVGKYCAITCPDQNNFVFISYFDNTNNRVKVAGSDNKGDSWATTIVDSTVESAICKTDIEVHDYASGPLWIAYTDASTNLGFARCDNYVSHFTTWSNTTIDSSVYLSQDLDVAYNSDANDLYIAYGDVDLDYLYLLKSIDGGITWQTRKGIDTSGGDAGNRPSVEVFNNLLFITHSTQTNSKFRLEKSKEAGDNW